MNKVVIEGRAIQKCLPKQLHKSDDTQLACAYADLMFAGNTKAAL